MNKLKFSHSVGQGINIIDNVNPDSLDIIVKDIDIPDDQSKPIRVLLEFRYLDDSENNGSRMHKLEEGEMLSYEEGRIPGFQLHIDNKDRIKGRVSVIYKFSDRYSLYETTFKKQSAA